MEVVATTPDNDGDWGRAAAAIDDGWAGRDDVTEAGGAQRDRATGAAAPNPDEGAFWATALGDGRGGATASDAPRHAAPRSAFAPCWTSMRRPPIRAIRRDRAAGRVLESPSPSDRAPRRGAESPPAAAPRRRPPAPNHRPPRRAARAAGAATGATAARSSERRTGRRRLAGLGRAAVARRRCARARGARRALSRARAARRAAAAAAAAAAANEGRGRGRSGRAAAAIAARALDGDAARWLRGMLHPTKNAVLDLRGSYRVFKCFRGPDHEWVEAPRTVFARGVSQACPCCRGLQVSVTNCVATRAPGVATAWRAATRNAPSVPPPERGLASSTARVWLACGAGLTTDYRAEVRAACAGRAACPACEAAQRRTAPRARRGGRAAVAGR